MDSGRRLIGVQDIMWLEHAAGKRALAIACWLGNAIVAQLPLAAITTVVRRHRVAGTSLRIAPVSREWLQKHETDRAKHEGGR